MEILLTPEQWVVDSYPINDFNAEYKLSNYIIKTEYENEILIIHTITWAIYALTKEEFYNILTNEILIKNKVVVPTTLDELSIAHNVYLKRITKPYLPNYNNINGLVILTTTSCNARCFYCYENDIEKKETMTTETAENIIQFIIKHKAPNIPINLSWFGGEPLLNKRIINYIIDRLYELNIPFKSSIITNGFLLDEDTINSLERWKINSIQITLDGLNEEYNKAKNYVYPDVDAYMVVIQNIHNVLDKTNSRISIRFNASNDNIFKLYDTLDYLKEEFKDHYNNKISFYVAPLFEYVQQENTAIDGFWDELDRISSTYKVAKLNKCDMILDEETFKRQKLDKHCMAFNATGMAIMPNGKFTPCEHVKDEDVFGDVVNGVTNTDVIKKWQTFDGPEIEYCKTSMCPLHPICPKFFKCDSSAVCKSKNLQTNRLKKAVDKLIRTRIFYNNYKQN